jgi:hypothetical protein
LQRSAATVAIIETAAAAPSAFAGAPTTVLAQEAQRQAQHKSLVVCDVISVVTEFMVGK